MRLRLKSVYHSAKSLPGKAKTLLFVRNFRASLSERRNPFHAESIVRLKVALMVPVAAVLGFVAAVTAFDGALATSFRNRICPAYKANRDPAPPELLRQFEKAGNPDRTSPESAGFFTKVKELWDDLRG